MSDRPNPEGVIYSLPSRFRFMLFAAEELLDVVCRERASATDVISAAAPYDWKSAEDRVRRQLEITSAYYRVVERELSISGEAVQELLQLADDTKTSLMFGASWKSTWPANLPPHEARAFEAIEAGVTPITHEKRKSLKRGIDAHVRLAAKKITPRLRKGGEIARPEVEDFVLELLNVGGEPKLTEREIEALRQWLDARIDDSCLTMKWEQRKVRELLATIAEADGEADFDTRQKVAANGGEDDKVVYGFRSKGAYFEVRFEGESGLVPADLAGTRYVAELLLHKNTPIRAIDLRGGVDLSERNFENELTDAKESRDRCRDRAAQLAKELKEAIEARDEPRQERIRRDLTEIEAEVRRLTGLGGRPRPNGKDPEKSAANSVKESLDLFRKKCRENWNLPRFAQHLESIETGGDVCYHPASPQPDWEF